MSEELKFVERSLEFANLKQIDDLWESIKAIDDLGLANLKQIDDLWESVKAIDERLKKLEQMMVKVVEAISIQRKLIVHKDSKK